MTIIHVSGTLRFKNVTKIDGNRLSFRQLSQLIGDITFLEIENYVTTPAVHLWRHCDEKVTTKQQNKNMNSLFFPVSLQLVLIHFSSDLIVSI